MRKVVRLGVSVAAMRESDGAYLLVKRGHPPAKHMWAFAGGKVDYGERLTAAAKRELFEETGLVIDEKHLSFLRPVEIIIEDADDTVSHFVLMCFSVVVEDIEPVAGDDALEACFYSLEQMRTLNATPSTLEIAAELVGDH
ncbi:MAG: NUDIX domain-containing protein [Pseudomonadota bacterium]